MVCREDQGLGPVCDLGCGPGHVARYLHDLGMEEIFGLDLSTGMVETARRLNPGIEFRQGNMLSLDAGDGSWGAIVAFYSIVHLPRGALPRALDFGIFEQRSGEQTAMKISKS